MRVSERKRKPISVSSLPPLPGSRPSRWSLGRAQPQRRTEHPHSEPPPCGSPTDLASPGDLLPNAGSGRWAHLAQDLWVPEPHQVIFSWLSFWKIPTPWNLNDSAPRVSHSDGHRNLPTRKWHAAAVPFDSPRPSLPLVKREPGSSLRFWDSVLGTFLWL